MEIQDNLILTWEVTRRTLAQSDLCAKTMWIAYDCKSSSWEWRYNAGRRDSGSCELNLPEYWGEDEWYLWLMFYDNKLKTISRAALLIISPGINSAKKDYPEQKPVKTLS